MAFAYLLPSASLHSQNKDGAVVFSENFVLRVNIRLVADFLAAVRECKFFGNLL